MAADQPLPTNEAETSRSVSFAPLVSVALVVLAVAAFNWTHLDRTVYSSDQINIATMLLQYGHPELFPTEQGLRSLDLYPNTYIGLLNILASLTGGAKQALFWLGTFLLFVFAAGMFVLLLEVTDSAWIAAAIAIASLWFRASFEGQHWQVADFTAFLPRTITFALVPWLLLVCMRWLGRWELVGIFAALGVAANYHPLSAIFLATIFGLTLLLVRKTRLQHIAILAVSVMVFAAASAPYSLDVTHAMRAAATMRRLKGGPQPSSEQIAEVRRLTPYATFPPPWATIRWVGFQMALPLLIGASGVWVRRRKLSDRDRLAVAFLGGVLLYSVGGAATEAAVRATIGLHKSFIFMRAFHLVYLPLWIFCGGLIVDLWNRRGRRERLGAALLAAALLIPASAPEYALRWVKYKGKIPQGSSLQSDPDLLAVCRWARENTEIADTFLVPPNWSFFPLFAERSMVASGKEVGFIIYEPSVGVEAWERSRTVQAAYEDPSPARLIEAAKRYGAAHIVVRDRALPGTPAFQTGPYRLYGVGR
jgi:hypothetical protein